MYVTSVAVLSDGRIVSGSYDKTIRIWNASSGECVKELSGHTDVSQSYCFSVCLFVC